MNRVENTGFYTGSGGNKYIMEISVNSMQIPLFLNSLSAKFVCHHNSRPTAISCLQPVPVSKEINVAVALHVRNGGWHTVVMADKLGRN